MLTDTQLQEHEVDFWLNNWNESWHEFMTKRFHTFYDPFFNFSTLVPPILEVGCGGTPVSLFFNIEETLIDPILDKLTTNSKFATLLRNKQLISESFLTTNKLPETHFNSIICLNCLDHFNNSESTFFELTHKYLKPQGNLYLYYHLRSTERDSHLALNQKTIDFSIHKYFNVIKYSKEMEPEVIGWADGCQRYILEKQ